MHYCNINALGLLHNIANLQVCADCLSVSSQHFNQEQTETKSLGGVSVRPAERTPQSTLFDPLPFTLSACDVISWSWC